MSDFASSPDLLTSRGDLVPLTIPSHQDWDARLVALIRAGETEAGGLLFDRHQSRVRSVLARIIGPVPELDDLIQEVFVEALTCLDRLENPSALRPWLCSVATLTARNFVRRRARRRWLRLVAPSELPDGVGAEQAPEAVQAVRAMYRVLDRLPADERVAFALRFVDGMELVDVALATQVSLSTVKRRLASAKQRFLKFSQREPELEAWLQAGFR